MATDRHWSVSLWRDPDDVPHCRILSSDKIEWRLISATLRRWRRCFVAHQLLLLLLLLLLNEYYYSAISSLKITSRTLFKVKKQNKIRCAQFEKIKGMTWRKDAFSDDAWRCRVSQTQWCWMARCSRHAAQQRRTRGHQSSYDTKMVWQGQTSTKIAASFSCIHVRHTT